MARFNPGGFTYAFAKTAEMSNAPGLCVGSDYLGVVSGTSPLGTYYTISVPFFFQSSSGLLESNGAEISFRIYCYLLGGSNSGAVLFGANSLSLIMHEVDPLLAQFSAGSGIISPAGGFVSSGSVADPLASLKTGIAPGTGALYSGGIGAKTFGSGVGFE